MLGYDAATVFALRQETKLLVKLENFDVEIVVPVKWQTRISGVGERLCKNKRVSYR